MKKLSEEQKNILEKCGTEAPFSGKHLKEKRPGEFVCVKCGNKLFSSKSKYDSGTGWPSFFDVINGKKVKIKKDFKMIIPRTEVVCGKCGGHLGHVFNDGPEPTGKRYCINSLALDFKKD